jgi:hypothetical protein
LNCQQLPRTAAFSKLQARAIEVKDHTPWQYLTAVQQRALTAKVAKTCKELRTQVSLYQIFGKLANSFLVGQ